MIKAKRFGRVLAAAVLLPCMAVTTVTAAPSTDELEQQRQRREKLSRRRRQTAVLQRLQRLAARVHLWEAPAEAVRRHQAPQVPAEADHLHPRAAAPRADPLPEADPQGHPAEMYQSPRRS